MLDAALALEKLDGKDVGGGSGHGDDVGAEVVGGKLGNDSEGVEDVGDLVGLGEVGAEEGALPGELGEKPLLAAVFGPVAVRPEAKVVGDGVDDVGVAFGFLADVEADERQAEGGDLPEEVQEAAVSNLTVSARAQRSVAELERFQKLKRKIVHPD